MKRFKLITSFLFYFYCVSIVFAICFWLYSSWLVPYSNKNEGGVHTSSGLIIGGLAFNNLNIPLIKRSYQLDLDASDTLIKYQTVINQDGKTIGKSEGLYRSSMPFSQMEDYVQTYQHNLHKKELNRKNVTYIYTDTILSKIEVGTSWRVQSSDQNSPRVKQQIKQDSILNASFPFYVSNPRQVTTEIVFKPKDPKLFQWIVGFNWFKYIVSAILSCFWLWCIGYLLNNFRNEKIFQVSNFRCLRWIGISIMLYGLLNSFENQLFASLNSEIGLASFSYNHWHVGAEELKEKINLIHSGILKLDFFTSPLMIGFAILILAEVFRKGFEMQQEQDLTI